VHRAPDAVDGALPLPLGPVVVGGLGGSGTRVVAEMLRRLDVYIGGDLNDSIDNLWWTLLFKLPRWHEKRRRRGADSIPGVIGVLEAAMTGRLGPDDVQRELIEEAAARSIECWRRRRLRDDRPPMWIEQRKASLLRSRELYPGPTVGRWGWKAPTSHVFVPELHAHFGDRFRYVHVIRNGLYMTKSTNQAQVHRWGPTSKRWSRRTSPELASLEYWIDANHTAISRGRELGPGRFLLVDYDAWCADPAPGVRELVEFLQVEASPELVASLESVPRAPTRVPDRSWIPAGVTERQLEQLAVLGYAVDGVG
jgi:hypothetical protein